MRRLCALLFVLLFCAQAGAADNEWRSMTPGAFPPTVEAAGKQLGQQGFSKAEVLFYKAELRKFLSDPETSVCKWETVPDDTVYGTMGMNKPGHGPVAYDLTKKLGRDDKAISCIVDGKTVHWYMRGQPADCNNVGVVVVVSSRKCVWVPNRHQRSEGRFVSVPELVVQSCNRFSVLPGQIVSVPGTTITGSQLVCQ